MELECQLLRGLSLGFRVLVLGGRVSGLDVRVSDLGFGPIRN